MNRVPCTSQWRCCFLLLPHCLIWVIRVVIPDCFGSLVWIYWMWTWCSDGSLRLSGKLTEGSVMLCLYLKRFSWLCFQEILSIFSGNVSAGTSPPDNPQSWRVFCLICEDVIIINKSNFASGIWMECSFVYGFLWARLQTGGWETVTSTNSHSS